MSDRKIITSIFIAFFVGIGVAYSHYLMIRPTPEQKIQLQIDRAIKSELCDRIDGDIDRFKEAPHSFQRTSLQVLLGESIESAKTLLNNLPDNKSIRYLGKKGGLLSECLTKARQWVKIKSAFPELYESERELVSLDNSRSVVIPSFIPELPKTEKVSGARLALVIGNSAYASKPLKNPENDAKDVSLFLKRAGFNVIELINADLPKLRTSIEQFAVEMAKNDVGLIYYSGHGIEFRGRNYLIPVNASIQNEEEIPRQAFDATEIIEKTQRINSKALILIIDACRNVPIFTKNRSAKLGLESMSVPSGAIIAFSAAPGQVALDGNGRNSPYTYALLKEAQVPNRRIEDVFKETAKVVSADTAGRQVPWYNSSLVGDFYFVK